MALQVRTTARIEAPVEHIWSLITDIALLPRINPGMLTAEGSMNTLGATRHCAVQNKGKEGSFTEKCVEFVPMRNTVWEMQGDTMGMMKMFRDIRFHFHLEPDGPDATRVTNESHYVPANPLAWLMNTLMMRGMVRKTQLTILDNLKNLAEQH